MGVVGLGEEVGEGGEVMDVGRHVAEVDQTVRKDDTRFE